MSFKKDFDTSKKIQEDENTDSGFLSGPISEQLTLEDCDLAEESERACSRLSEEDPEPELQLDSGLDLSECLSSVKLSDSAVYTPTSQTTPTVTIGDEKTHDIPPLAILFQQDDDGDTQLHIAAVHGCEKSVGTLVRVCPDKDWLNVPNDFGQTALHLAAMSGHAVVTRMLVMAGASLGIRDLVGNTPLHVAAAAGYVGCLQALLAPAPEQQQRRLASTLNQKNYNGQTCVHVAAMAGHVDALQTLVYYGANINAAEGLCGWTPLHVAAARGDVDTARYLLEKCAGVDPSALDYAGRTARKLALKNKAAALFDGSEGSEEEDSDSEDEMLLESDQSLFDRIRDGMNAINVA
uniref:Cactus n=1 Tax=Plutella xylostella TaxID=51655 RepID=A0A678THX9_PLUXY|nr:cactus [Plutella xylostella]